MNVNLGGFLMAGMLAFVMWIFFCIVAGIFPNFYRQSYRLGKTRFGESFLNGLLIFALFFVLFFALGFLFKGSANMIPLFAVMAVFSLAGSVIGVALLGGAGNIIDGEKRPAAALAVGMTLIWIISVFSEEIASWINMAVGTYGAGAMLLYFRGARVRDPDEPIIKPEAREKAGGPPERTEPAGPARKESFFGNFGYLIAAVAMAVFAFYGIKLYNKMFSRQAISQSPAKIPQAKSAPVQNLSSKEISGEAERLLSEMRSKGLGYQDVKNASRSWPIPEEQKKRILRKIAEALNISDPDTITPEGLKEEQSAYRGKFATGEKATRETGERSILDIEAQMWAYRIKGGEFSYGELKGYSENWISPEEYKKKLFERIKEYLVVENLKNISREEVEILNEYNKRQREK